MAPKDLFDINITSFSPVKLGSGKLSSSQGIKSGLEVINQNKREQF